MFAETAVAVEAVGKREWLSRGVAAVNVQVVVVIGDAWVIHGEASGGVEVMSKGAEVAVAVKSTGHFYP